MKREKPLLISAVMLLCGTFLAASSTPSSSHLAPDEADVLPAVEQVPTQTRPPHRGHAPVIPTEVLQQRPCVVECEPNEGEETCYDGYVDDYNGGCVSDPPVFQLIECGQTICGTSGVFPFGGSTYRDMDWFEVTLDTAAQITWAGEAEFPVAMWILSGDCDDIVVEEYATAAECTPLSLSHACGAGLYMLVIAPADWGDYACGVKYEATVTCDAFFGVCCYGYNGSECAETTESECFDVLNGDWYFGETCDTLSCDWPCWQSNLDVAILTDAWPSETTWEVTDHATGVVMCAGGPYADDNTLYEARCCILYTDCVDFTIYDSYGDGIYAPGGYTVILDDEVIYDCMGEGWHGDEETVEYIGEACVLPTGACCLDDHGCFATTYEDLCDALGGMWYQGETCPEFWCPGPWPDFEVEAPYTSPVRTTCFSYDDCLLWSTEDDGYEVTIPSAGLWSFNTCLLAELDTLILLGTAQCSENLGYNFNACGLQSEIVLYLEPGVYFCTIEGFDSCGNYIFDVHDATPTGACCLGPDCVATNYPDECDALGGDWYIGEDCATFECPGWGCPESRVDIAILTDYWGEETTWEITDHTTGAVICSGGPYDSNTLYNEGCCIGYDDCVDFTIYDSYGDGIIAPGGYIVTLDDVEIANAMGGGFTGYEETVEYIGGGCVPDTGACCDQDQVCVATNTEEECDALGGVWYIFETCPEFNCEFWWYCTPCYSDLDDDYITNVTFNTIDNDTGPEGAPCSYSKYWGMSTEVELEETYQVSVSVDGNGSWTQYVSVWFDWDHNDQFETDHQLGSVLITPGTPVTITADITIPADADLGGTYMRVIERYAEETTDPCEDYTYGEAEDYWVVVTSGVCGDFDGDGDVDVDDFYFFLDAFGTCVGDDKYEEACDFDGDECITLVDYQMWMQCYHDANGKLSTPPIRDGNLSRQPAGRRGSIRP